MTKDLLWSPQVRGLSHIGSCQLIDPLVNNDGNLCPHPTPARRVHQKPQVTASLVNNDGTLIGLCRLQVMNSIGQTVVASGRSGNLSTKMVFLSVVGIAHHLFASSIINERRQALEAPSEQYVHDERRD